LIFLSHICATTPARYEFIDFGLCVLWIFTHHILTKLNLEILKVKTLKHLRSTALRRTARAMICVLALCTLCCTFSGTAFGGGFQIGDQGGAGMGRARAYVAGVNDASAIYYNPSAIAFMSGLNFYAGGTYIAPTVQFQQPGAQTTNVTKATSQTFFPPVGFVTYNMDGVVKGLSVGAGVYVPYGLSIAWPSDWVGRATTTKVSLNTVYISGNAAYRIMDNLSVAVGFTYATSSVELDQAVIGLDGNEGTAKLSATGTGTGYNFSATYKPSDMFTLGFAYKSKVKVDYNNGTATFTFPASDLVSAAMFPNGPGSSTITNPASWKVGASVKPFWKSSSNDILKNLEVEVDYDWHGWSAYHDLPVTFTKADGLQTNLLQNSTSIKNFQDTYTISAALETVVFTGLKVRAGFMYDEGAVPAGYVEPLLPDANKFDITFGVGYDVTKNLGVDVSVGQLYNSDITESIAYNGQPKGTYKGAVGLASVGVRLKF
jgi:long-chain fatty acid transport protein